MYTVSNKNWATFCRAMLRKRSLSRHAVYVCVCVSVGCLETHIHKICMCACMYVCVSVTFVHSLKTNKHIFKIVHTILVFSAPNDMAIFRREPTATGASNADGVDE